MKSTKWLLIAGISTLIHASVVNGNYVDVGVADEQQDGEMDIDDAAAAVIAADIIDAYQASFAVPVLGEDELPPPGPVLLRRSAAGDPEHS